MDRSFISGSCLSRWLELLLKLGGCGLKCDGRRQKRFGRARTFSSSQNAVMPQISALLHSRLSRAKSDQ